MTETEKRLTHCLKAMGISRGMGAAIFLTVGEEEQQQVEMLHYMKPVRQPKEFSKFGNGALQQLVSEVGVQELARINAQRQERLAVLDDVHSG